MGKIIRFILLALIIVVVLYACTLMRATPENSATTLSGDVLPALSLAKQAVNGTAVFNAVGQVINYSYVVTNIASPALAGPVTITDDKAIVVCPNVNTVGNLDNNLDQNENITCVSAYSITQADLTAGSVTNNATARAGGIDSNKATIVVKMTENKVLTLTKSANPTSYSQVGQTITYTYVIKNTGAPTLGPAQFIVRDDRIPTPINCGAATATLATNEMLTCSAVYTIAQADMAANQIINTATASGGGAGVIQPATSTITNTNLQPIPGTPSTLPKGTTIQHKVVKDEWLIQIARCYGADFTALRNANPGIIDPDFIVPDTIVTVPNIGSNGKIYGPPCVVPYVVQLGDTWNSIAQKHNADLAVLQEANEGVVLSNGVRLKIPINSAGWNGSPPSGQPIPTACNRAELVSDVNFPDGTTVVAGSTFTKTWRVKNTGTCTWTTSYVLIFDHGERMDAPATVPLPTGTVAPNATVDVSVNLKAPATPGTYQGDFRLRSPDNIVFGTGSTGQNTFWVRIVVPQQTTAKIAFHSARDANGEIYVMNPDGTNQVRLTNNNADDDNAAWSPNGSKIAFISARDGNDEIYVMNADGSNQLRLTNNTAPDSPPVWSRDSSKIVFRSDRDGNGEIYVMNADGTNQVRLTNNTAVEDVPAWSPDGSKIAFMSERDGNAEIYVMNADGTNPVRLTNNNARDSEPAWSPDGGKIAFYSDRDGNVEIYVMNADGTNQVRLTNNGANDIQATWSPNGSKIAFISERDGNAEIYVMNADGTNQVRLTNNNALDFVPAWSPDDSKIVFRSDRDGNGEIYVMNVDGSNQIRLTNNNALDDLPDWVR